MFIPLTDQRRAHYRIRENEAHLIPNPKSRFYHFLIVCSKANYISEVEVQIPLSPRTLNEEHV